MKDIKNYSQKELKETLNKKGFPGFCAQQIFDWVYKKRKEDFDLMTNLSKEVREGLKTDFYFSKLKFNL